MQSVFTYKLLERFHSSVRTHEPSGFRINERPRKARISVQIRVLNGDEVAICARSIAHQIGSVSGLAPWRSILRTEGKFRPLRPRVIECGIYGGCLCACRRNYAIGDGKNLCHCVRVPSAEIRGRSADCLLYTSFRHETIVRNLHIHLPS